MSIPSLFMMCLMPSLAELTEDRPRSALVLLQLQFQNTAWHTVVFREHPPCAKHCREKSRQGPAIESTLSLDHLGNRGPQKVQEPGGRELAS